MKSLLFLFLSISAIAADKKKPDYPTDVRVEVDVSYLDDTRKEKADLYFPKELFASAPVPAVIWIHGGGFNDGDKAKGRETNFCHEMALHGYFAMSINYKLRRMDGQVTWPKNLYDAKTAVRWLRANAVKYGIDPDRIAVAGGSAGGNLAAMLGVTDPADGLEPLGEGSTKVSCAIDFYGAVDLLHYHDMKMFAKTRIEAPELYVKGSPITYVDAQDAPLLLVHGTKDETVALSQSETLAAKCKEAGLEHELIVVPSAPHTFKLVEDGIDLRPQVFAFLDKHLKRS